MARQREIYFGEKWQAFMVSKVRNKNYLKNNKYKTFVIYMRETRRYPCSIIVGNFTLFIHKGSTGTEPLVASPSVIDIEV